MAINFSAPQYIQTKDKKPAYHFVITAETPLIHTSEKKPELSDTLTSSDGVDFLKSFAEAFAAKCSKYFPKPLVAERLIGKLTHVIKTIDDTHEGDGIVNWYFIPVSICVSGITLEVHWKVVKTTSVIQWEEEEAEAETPTPTCQDQQGQDQEGQVEQEQGQAQERQEEQQQHEEQQQEDSLEEVTDLPQNTTGDEKPEFILGPSAAAKEKEKKRLREAKLQVELARFRAARAYEKYVAKYGDDLSDTDTEGEESEYE